MRIYTIEGEDAKVCRMVRREGKLVKRCQKSDTSFVAHSTRGLVCLRNNFDRLFDSLGLPQK